MRPGHALVLFSGGQDSTTCLAWALEHFAHVETIGFDYGQRHHIELQARQTVLASLRAQFPHWNARLGDDHMLDLAVLGHISDTALTSDAEIQMTAAGLPNTFVPGRNLLFFQLAAAVVAGVRVVHDQVDQCLPTQGPRQLPGSGLVQPHEGRLEREPLAHA